MKKKDVLNREGKILFKTELKKPKVIATNLLEAEQYLNSTVAVDIFKKFKIGFRFHV